MLLQSLELVGFKSFAQKTVLNFHRSVTAIVGPNGCGKSNVLDAIRWVLGEQSAKALRGSEMTDVIFGGTDSRPELGMAEVSLSFVECEKELGAEWSEVRITRRVFRDGRSEYFLNNNPSRLRDIHQLFMDTGVGRSAYSIMEQGKIDLILSSKPEDRRAIFEEAAGITKYNAQKREAVRKLDATEANILRVEDILKEIKRQIGSLQRQAGKARRYQALISDLRILDTHLSHRQFKELDDSLAATLAELERLRKLRDDHEHDLEIQDAEFGAQRRVLEEMDQQISTANQVVQDLRNHISNSEARVVFNAERVRELSDLAGRCRRDIAGAQEKIRIQETQIQDTDVELKRIVDAVRLKQEQHREKKQALDVLNSQRLQTEDALQGAFSSINQIEVRISSLRKEISNVIRFRDSSESSLSILHKEISLLAISQEDINRQLANTNSQIEKNSAALVAEQATIHLTEQSLSSAKIALDQIECGLFLEQRVLTEKKSKLEILLQLNEEGEGFAAGTRAVLRGLDNPDFFKPSILGALTAHIEVEQPFIPAIEAALGQNLQIVIMTDLAAAVAAIRTLSDKKLGRASLSIGRTKASSANLETDIRLPEGAICWAVDKVKTQDDAAELVAQLLRGTVLVADLKIARSLHNNYSPNGLQFVTLAGELLSREGILQVGEAGEAVNSILQRKNQIKQLDIETVALEARIQEIIAQRDDAIALFESTQVCFTKSREELQRLNISTSTLRSQASILEHDRQETNKKVESLYLERSNIETRYKDASEQLQGLELELTSSGCELDQSQTRLSELQSNLEQLRFSEAIANSELNELLIQVATEKQRENNLYDERQPMATRLLELREFISQCHRDIDTCALKTQTLNEESERIKGEIETFLGRIQEAEHKAHSLDDERVARMSVVEGQESTLRMMRRQLNDCQEQRRHQEVKQTQVQLRIENLTEYVMRRYQTDIREFQPDSYSLICTLRDQSKRTYKVSDNFDNASSVIAPVATDEPEEAPPAGNENIDWYQVEVLVKEMGQRIDSMGPINLDAIQEYDELEQRHAFIEQQFNELTIAKTELHDVIAKINTTTRQLFADTFERIRANFDEMFTELFGGGKANLVLKDEANPLESGIEIVAKPPGKQLQSITLLSGGEKTMTAVAILFSIFTVKPSPFCVLDEMDAALDESNISRFVKILDRFVTQSQFVVITHSKRTLAKADVIYGVTMQEHGVSRLLSFQFPSSEGSRENSGIIDSSNSHSVPSIADSFGKSGDLNSEQLQATHPAE